MKNSYEYNITSVAGDELKIEDTGNCTIKITDFEDKSSFLFISTELGYTTVVQFGPTAGRSNVRPYSIRWSYDYFEYSEYRIDKIINRFLSVEDIRAELVDRETAKNCILDIRELF